MTERSIAGESIGRHPVDRRHYVRVALNPDLHFASLGPMGDHALPVPVLNLSPDGAAICAAERPRWLDGNVDLSLRAGKASIPCRVRSTRVSHFRGEPVYGVELHFDESASSAIAIAYHKLRFSMLKRRGALSETELLRLFHASGYLALKEGLAPSPTWLRADWPNTLTHEAVYVTRDDRALGHVTVTRAYPNAWLGHEIATLRDHPEALACRRALYHHFSIWPRLLDGTDAHLLGYYNRSRPWHRKMFEDFAARSRPTDCLVLPMDRYVTKSFADVPEALDSDARTDGSHVVEVHAGSEAACVRLIEHHWPLLARRSFDIREQRLATDCLHPAYPDAGLRRSRSVLQLTARGKVLGAALCEWSDSQISLFNVLNLAHVFIDPDAGPSPTACNRLVQAVRRFYAERELAPPLLTCPPGTFAGMTLTGCSWTETMGCIIWNAHGLRSFERYVDEVLPEPVEGLR